MQPRLKLWIEQDGRIALSDYRVRLLEQVQRSGSLAHAAAKMGLSYRRAWGKVKELEANLGVALVMSETGGAGGGGTRLTPAGERLVQGYARFHDLMEDALSRAFAESFPPEDADVPAPSDMAP